MVLTPNTKTASLRFWVRHFSKICVHPAVGEALDPGARQLADHLTEMNGALTGCVKGGLDRGAGGFVHELLSEGWGPSNQAVGISLSWWCCTRACMARAMALPAAVRPRRPRSSARCRAARGLSARTAEADLRRGAGPAMVISGNRPTCRTQPVLQRRHLLVQRGDGLRET